MLGDVAALSQARDDAERHWRFMGAAMRERAETGVDLFDETESAEFLGFTIRFEPGTEQERDWLEAGRAMPAEDSVEAAREYLGLA